MVDVFISYSRKDSKYMKAVKDALDEVEISVWTDEDLMPGTINWDNEIERVMKEAQAIVTILSPEAKNSEWMNRELSYSSVIGLPIFPLLVRGDVKESIPLQLITHNVLDARTDMNEGIDKLIELLKGIGITPGSTRKERVNKATTLAKRAEEHFFANRYQEAISESEDALKIDRVNTEALIIKSDAHKVLGEFDAAIQAATRAIKRAPDNIYPLQIRAEALLLKGESANAVVDANRALELDPENTSLLQIRADANLTQENFDLVIEDTNKIIKKEKWNAYAFRTRAEAFLMMGEKEKALEDASQAVKLDPENEAAKRIDRLARSDRLK